MTQQISRIWQQWKKESSRKRFYRLERKHKEIAECGIKLSAEVTAVYPGPCLYNGSQIYRLGIGIRVNGEFELMRISKTIVKNNMDLTKLKRINFRCLPGDLSQIVIIP